MRAVMSARASFISPSVGQLSDAASECRGFGTALVGDISNTLESLDTFLVESIDATLFHEFLGFDVEADEAKILIEPLVSRIAERVHGRVQVRAAAHAPYSVSAELFRAISRLPGPRSVHLAESEEEVEFLISGKGPWRDILEERGRMDHGWVPPRARPVDYLQSVGWLREDTIVVHGVQLVDDEIDGLVKTGSTLVVCPRSNDWTGAGVPPVSYTHLRAHETAS